jgi:multiple sugar transport system permease protein
MSMDTTAQQVAAAAARQRNNDRLKLIAMYVFMTFLAFIFIFPVVFMIVSSFKPNEVIFQDLRSLNAFLPTTFSLDNYHQVFERSNFGLFMFNSIFITTIAVTFGLLVNSMAAYALSRLKWRGRLVMLSVILALLIIPFETIAIPLLFVVTKLPWLNLSGGITLETSWLNSYQVQIIPFIADAFSIFLFYQFFLDIPKDIDEAALVDGASPFRIFWSIILPISRPVVATVAILQFLVRWNDYLWPVIAVQGEAVRPVMVGMAAFFGQTPDWGQIMAYATMITVPVLFIYLLFQRWFIQSVASSGIKG